MATALASYPGDKVGHDQLLLLAESYHRAADVLLPASKGSGAIGHAPWRFVALQAIELYLAAGLRHTGVAMSDVRAMGHDFDRKMQRLFPKSVALRRTTRDHLVELARQREYLCARYAPEQLAGLSQINRLNATLQEVASKVRKQAAP